MGEFKFGLEAEFLIANKNSWAPLWHRDLTFGKINALLEDIPIEDFGDLSHLRLEAPHAKVMPYVVEGYHIPDQDFTAIDLKPKGVEIRTPIANSIDQCLHSFEKLLARLQQRFQEENLAPISLSHHPTEIKFEGPQNKRRHDFWQWAMEVMTTYGPDINVRLPDELREQIDFEDLEEKINFYSPSLSALSAASPFVDGDLWKIRGHVGHSFRMYKRSVIAPPIEIHPDQDWRLEFKAFDMPLSTQDFRCQFLCFLGLLLSPELKGRASRHTRIYDLGQVARFGLEAPDVQERLNAFFKTVPSHLRAWGFDPAPLETFERRAKDRRTPASALIEIFQKNNSDLASVICERANFQMDIRA